MDECATKESAQCFTGYEPYDFRPSGLQRVVGIGYSVLAVISAVDAVLEHFRKR